MPVARRIAFIRPVSGLLALFAAAFALAAQPPEPVKKSPEIPKAPAPRESIKVPPPLGLKLPDGTYQWPGPGTTEGERILLTPQEYQKLLDRIEQLKQQLAGRKGLSPSSCAIRAKIDKRGAAAVASIKLSYSVRTTAPNAVLSLGAKRAFLVSASLDGNKLPVLDSVDEGFAVGVEAAGDHAIVLDVECPITSRGGKPEIGFELGLPRAAITTLIFEPPSGQTRVSLVTRTTDASQAMKPAEPRRVSNLDAKALAAPQPNRDAYPLGPIESLEVLWEPAATAVAEAVQTAEVDVVCSLTEGFVETAAKFRPRGSARTWRFAAPADAEVTVDRAPGATSSPDAIPGGSPAISKPADAAKPIWNVDLPAGTSAADWVVSAVVRMERPKPAEAAHKGPFALGPFAVLDVARQTGSVKIATAANARLIVKHGAELRQDVLPAPAAENETAVFFKLATGAAGNAPPTGPLLTVEVQPLAGKVAIRPIYKLTLTDGSCSVRAELRIAPIRTAIDSATIELPADWRGIEVSPPELVASSQLLKSDGPRQVLAVRLAAEHKQAFDLVLTASVPLAARESALLMPRFPNAIDRDAMATAIVPEGFEVRGTGREWDGDQPAAWGHPLTATPGTDGKEPKTAHAIGGKFERGLARLDLAWSPYRPPLSAEVRAEIVVHESQIVVGQRIAMRSPDGFPRTVRFHGAAELKGLAPFDLVSPGIWSYSPAADVKDASFKFEYAIPLPRRTGDETTRKVPISLVLPIGASRTETLARVWVVSGAGRTVTADAGAWREQPPEPAADRESLPALTLAGAGHELPLVLDIREAPDTGAAAVWVERGLLQASVGDEGTAYRVRLLLRRWLSDSIDIRLPDSLAGVAPEVFLDDPPKRANAAIATAANGERTMRVPLPAAKPGRTVVLELRYALPNGPGGESAIYAAPRPIAAFAGPMRWHVAGPAGTVPLVLSGGRAEQRWRTRFGMLVPVSTSNDDLEKWFQTGMGDESSSGNGEAVVVRVNGPDTVAIAHPSRLYLVIACSMGALLVGLLLSRLPGWLAGPLLALSAGGMAVAAVLYPQAAAQAAGAAEPGLATLLLVLAVQTFTRWNYRQRITYLPGFARSRPETAALASTSGGSQPKRDPLAPTGSTGSAIGPQPASSGS